jgi:hypothetical protein
MTHKTDFNEHTVDIFFRGVRNVHSLGCFEYEWNVDSNSALHDDVELVGKITVFKNSLTLLFRFIPHHLHDRHMHSNASFFNSILEQVYILRRTKQLK